MCKILYQYKSLFISFQEILFHVAQEALGTTTLKYVFFKALVIFQSVSCMATSRTCMVSFFLFTAIYDQCAFLVQAIHSTQTYALCQGGAQLITVKLILF